MQSGGPSHNRSASVPKVTMQGCRPAWWPGRRTARGSWGITACTNWSLVHSPQSKLLDMCNNTLQTLQGLQCMTVRHPVGGNPAACHLDCQALQVALKQTRRQHLPKKHMHAHPVRMHKHLTGSGDNKTPAQLNTRWRLTTQGRSPAVRRHTVTPHSNNHTMAHMHLSCHGSTRGHTVCTALIDLTPLAQL